MRTIKAKHHEEEVNSRDRKARRRQALAQQQSKLQVLSAYRQLLLISMLDTYYYTVAF